MAKQQKSSRISVIIAALSTLFLFLLVFNYYHSMNIGKITTPNDKEENLHDHMDLRHFSVMNETLSGLNQELRRIMALHKTKLSTDASLPNNAVSASSNQPSIIPVITNVVSTKPHAQSSAVVTTKSTPRPQAVTPAVISSTSPRSSTVKKALLYTMDSITSYEEDSKRGGASGELLIRHCLENAFKELHVYLDVKTSDAAFESAKAKDYDIIIMDPWTWAAPGWVPKHHIRGLDDRIYILDFFGSKQLRGSGLNVPPSRFLTAFETNDINTFLGYYMDIPPSLSLSLNDSSDGQNKNRGGQWTKKDQGVIWGKDIRHFEGRSGLLTHIADHVPLIATATTPLFQHKNIHWKGHQTSLGWLNILLESKFLIGMGDPLLGPSAIDAIAMGCMFINPLYTKPVRETFHSQHPYAAKKLSSYVCSYQMNDRTSLMKCVDQALHTNITPFVIPADFTKSVYMKRVKKIFKL